MHRWRLCLQDATKGEVIVEEVVKVEMKAVKAEPADERELTSPRRRGR